MALSINNHSFVDRVYRHKTLVKGVLFASTIILALGLTLAATQRLTQLPPLVARTLVGVSTPFFTVSLALYLMTRISTLKGKKTPPKEPIPEGDYRRTMLFLKLTHGKKTHTKVDFNGDITIDQFERDKPILITVNFKKRATAIRKEESILVFETPKRNEKITVKLFENNQWREISNWRDRPPEVERFLEEANGN